MLSHLKKLYGNSIQALKDDKGQGLVEYALILVLIAIVVIAAVRGIGSNANNTFQKVNSAITAPSGS